MVLSDAFRAVPVEPESILVLPDAIVEPPNLERHVLTRQEGGRGGGDNGGATVNTKTKS